MSNFITNMGDITLSDRLKQLIKVSEELKFLVGFFYFSGWQEIYSALKDNKQAVLKILVGLEVDRYLSNIVETGDYDKSLSNEEHFSRFIKSLDIAINNPQMDNMEFYNQLHLFIDMLKCGRLVIKKTLKPNHAKLYLFKFTAEHQSIVKGAIITGSSNLTKAGLYNQNEFNVEIKDYGFEEAEKYFNNLWKTSAPITDYNDGSGKEIILDFLKNKTQASPITPFEAYAYMLKTYLELYESRRNTSYIKQILEENDFNVYSYQIDAVNQALNIIDTYGGVIIADVVGLGKSIVAALIANKLGKRGLILCPPGLIGDKNKASGWYEYWHKFKLYNWDIESSGNVENIAKSIKENNMDYEIVIVDEAHRFRNQDTSSYEALANICRGKIVILLTATPFNNSPADIFSLLKLFIVPGQSSITIDSDLESRFRSYNYRFKNLSFILKNYNSNNKNKADKAKKLYEGIFGQDTINKKKIQDEIKRMANDIKNIISPVVIRRNRLDLKADSKYKKETQAFSIIKDPQEIFYKLSKEQLDFYDKIIKDYFGNNGRFTGAIYRPFEYEKLIKDNNIDEDTNRTLQQQRNLFDFMRRLLIKRFESSFGAFKRSIERFLKTHKMVREFIKKSHKYILDRRVIESIYNDDDGADSFTLEAIKEALNKFKENAKERTSPKHTKIYDIEKFKRRDKFLQDIDKDIKLFKDIKEEIDRLDLVKNDPKRKEVLKVVKEILNKGENPKRKVIIFTEYTDTLLHLKDYFKKELGRVMVFEGNITKSLLEKLNSNFNARAKDKSDDFDILITTDRLSEGVNLNRAGAIINYDIPWNPTRVIQRLGRINRIGAKVFDELFIYNIFPTEKGADHIRVREIATEKMFLIHSALGEDAKIFTPDEEPTPSGLFNKLNANPEEEQELSTITIIRNEFNDIKQKYPRVIEKIKTLPNRIKTAKSYSEDNVVVFRKKGMAIFSLLGRYRDNKIHIEERPFLDLLEFVRCTINENRLNLSDRFWYTYEAIKKYTPQIRNIQSDQSINQKAFSSLKALLSNRKKINIDIDQQTIVFIDTLLKDIKDYKTLPTNTLRKLTLPKNPTQKDYKKLIKNIKQLQKDIGNNYLEITLQKTTRIKDDIIIAVENKKLV